MAAASDLSRFATELVESDIRYFEAGAIQEPLAGGVLVHMPGFEALAAGCVVQRIEGSQIGDADEWLERIESRVLRLGARMARLYLSGAEPAFEASLERRAYRRRGETGFVRSLAGHDGDPAEASICSLHEVKTASDWARKLELHRECTQGADGHHAPAEMWVHMERRKTDAGYMKPLLVIAEREVVGAVAAADCGDLLRLKNLVVAPPHRGRGIAMEATNLIVALALEMKKRAVGCFAIDGSHAETVYRRCGLQLVTHQVEWARDLVGR